MALDFDPTYGFPLPSASCDDSASPLSDNEDDLAFNDADASVQQDASIVPIAENGNGKRKSRRPPSTAERRATHNAVERARRESLNGRFMELATALPTMANVKRPSKSVIVAKSLEFVYAAEDREKALREENAALRREVEELRAKLNMGPSSPSAPIGIQKRSPSIVSRDTFGSYEDPVSLLSCSPTSVGTPFDASPLSTVQAIQAAAPITFSQVFGQSLTPPSNDSVNTPPVATEKSNSANKGPTPINILAANHSVPASVAAMSYHSSIPSPIHPAMPAYMDVNYLMALSLQQQQQQQQQHQQQQHHQQHQQQQQNALNMAMSSTIPNWSAYNYGFNGMNHPISASKPDYTANLAYA